MAIDLTQDPVTLVYDLKRESNSDRSRHHAQWKENKNLYGGKHWDTTANEGQSHLVVNLIRNAVNGMLAVMTQEPPETIVSPMETDIPGLFYLKPESGPRFRNTLLELRSAIENGQIPQEQMPTAALEAANSIEEQHFLGMTPLVPEQFEILSEHLNPLTQQQFLSEQDVFRVDDIAVADLLQRVLDGVWNRFGWEDLVQNYVLDAIVMGHVDVIVEYDDSRHDVVITKALEKDSWIDPNPIVKNIPQGQHYLYAQVLGIEKAVRKFPEHEVVLRRNAEDPGSAQSATGEPLSDRYTDIDWERDMAVIYTCWIRDQTMTQVTITNKKGDLVTKKLERPVVGLREIRIIADQLLYDGPSQYTDIPATRFKFITIIDSSYSVGFPEILRDLQKSFNRVISNLSDHTKYLAQPMVMVEEELANRVFKDHPPFANLTNIFKIPIELMDREVRDPLSVAQTPSLNTSYIAFLQLLRDIFNDMSNQGDVIRGIASSKAESGKAIDALQGAANRILSLASKWMDHAVKRMNELTISHMVSFMPIEKWALYTEKYPMNVLKALIDRAKLAQFNVKVETAGTKQQKRVQKQQKALLMRQNGAISLQTFLKEMEIENPEEEAKRIINEQKTAAEAQMRAELAQRQAESEAEAAIEQIKNRAKLQQIELEQELETKKELALARIKEENETTKASAA